MMYFNRCGDTTATAISIVAVPKLGRTCEKKDKLETNIRRPQEEEKKYRGSHIRI